MKVYSQIKNHVSKPRLFSAGLDLASQLGTLLFFFGRCLDLKYICLWHVAFILPVYSLVVNN